MNHRKIAAIVFNLALAFGIAITTLPAQAAVPQTLNYQGQLTSAAGVPVNSGPAGISITFKLYDATTAGNLLWTETQSVTVSNGLYSVTLGQSTPLNPGTPLTPTLFGVPLFLGITVGTDPEMIPRIALSSSATALRASLADTAATADALAPTATVAGSQVTGSISASQISGSITNATIPGVLPWGEVTGTSAQAAANTGYLANNAAQVTITLPAAPAMGDLVSVTGVGSGGWKVAQNAGQTIVNSKMIGVNWTPHETARNWTLVASSADGTKLVAIPGDPSAGFIYTSVDSGVTWSATNSVSNVYTSVAMSADGTKMFAWAKWGDFYTSTNSGASWALVPWWPGSGNLALASSADGTKLVAAKNGGQIYTSIDSGANWTLQASSPAGAWTSVVSSADGTKLAAVGPSVYTSTDSGVTWMLRNSVAGGVRLASSADGTKLALTHGVGGSPIHTSTDSGATWTPRESARSWSAIASSADGTKLVASITPPPPLPPALPTYGQLYISTDSGVSWTPHASTANWPSVAMSADGFRIVAVGTTIPIYISVSNTITGITGSLSGGQYDAVDLQCVGNNTFLVRGYAGNLLMQ